MLRVSGVSADELIISTYSHDFAGQSFEDHLKRRGQV